MDLEFGEEARKARRDAELAHFRMGGVLNIRTIETQGDAVFLYNPVDTALEGIPHGKGGCIGQRFLRGIGKSDGEERRREAGVPLIGGNHGIKGGQRDPPRKQTGKVHAGQRKLTGE